MALLYICSNGCEYKQTVLLYGLMECFMLV